jgi:hypothetical protein
LADAVEKVCSVPSARNNSITLADFLNDFARSTLVLNQYCSQAPPKILFNSIRPPHRCVTKLPRRGRG